MDPIAKLTAGFKVFREGRFQEQRTTYEALVDRGQNPKVALIACSDSRVDPATVLQADPGDLFIIRNVANLVPPYEREGHYHGTSTAVEYAVQHLGVGHVIVLGHAHCGGIRSLFERPDENSQNNHFVPPWMSLVQSAYLRSLVLASRTGPFRALRQKSADDPGCSRTRGLNVKLSVMRHG